MKRMIKLQVIYYKDITLKIIKKYIDDIYIEKFFSRLNCKEDCKEEEDVKDDNFEIKTLKKICFYPPCLNKVIGDNYSSIHNKDML